MKNIYIPSGETVCYENLATDRIVVNGCLKVLGDIKAKSISGSGVIYAGTVSVNDIRVDDLESSSVTCCRLLAKRVQTPQLIASESAAVSCYLAASYVETGKLTVASSEICEAKAGEIIHLPPRKRSLFRLLLVSSLRSLWLRLTAPDAVGEMPPELPITSESAEPAYRDEKLESLIADLRIGADSFRKAA